MGYDSNDYMVRVDFFKDSGKWYCTEAVNMNRYYNEPDIYDAVRKALREHLGDRLQGMTAVVLEPYHAHAFPLMIKDW